MRDLLSREATDMRATEAVALLLLSDEEVAGRLRRLDFLGIELDDARNQALAVMFVHRYLAAG